MKRLTITLFFLIGLMNCNAQEPIKRLMGGSFKYNYLQYKSDSGDVKIDDLSFGTTIGAMVSDKVAAGIAFQYNKNIQDVVIADSNSLSLLLFLRLHSNITEKFKFYIEPNLGSTFLIGDNSKNDLKIYNVKLNFGFLYFISPKLSLELMVAGIDYKHISDKDYNLKGNDISIKYDLVTPNIGMKYYF